MCKGAYIYTHVCAHAQKLCARAQTDLKVQKIIILHSVNAQAAQAMYMHLKIQTVCAYIHYVQNKACQIHKLIKYQVN